jgi:CheY-like chemotaxis protein
MPETPMHDVSALIATEDKRTLARAKHLFKHVREISTAHHLNKVFEEAHVRQAGKVAERKQFDLMVIDVDMPSMSGLDVISKLRESSSGVVMLVLASDGEEALRAVRSGAEDYIMKPIRQEDLETRIQVLLKRLVDRRKDVMPKMDAPLPHLVEKLHDRRTGHLDAKEISDFFGLSVAEFARVIGRGVSTVHKTSTAPALQEALRPFEAMASGLIRLTGSERRARMWLHAPNPALAGHAPFEWLQSGKVADLANFIQDLLEGRPA